MPCAGAAPLRVRVKPARATKGRPTRFRVRVRGRRRGLRATVSFAGRRIVSDSRGRATFRAAFDAPGRRRVVARAADGAAARAWVRVRG